MVDVRGDVLRPPHGTTPAAVKSNIKSEVKVKHCGLLPLMQSEAGACDQENSVGHDK